AHDIADAHVLRQSEGPEPYQFAGIGADDGNAKYAPAPAGDELEETFGAVVGLRPVDLAERPAKYTDLPVRFARLRLGQTDRSYLGVGIGDPRYELRPLADPHPEKDRLRRQPGMVIRHMGELPSGDVADCIDVSIGRAQPMVD